MIGDKIKIRKVWYQQISKKEFHSLYLINTAVLYVKDKLLPSTYFKRVKGGKDDNNKKSNK